MMEAYEYKINPPKFYEGQDVLFWPHLGKSTKIGTIMLINTRYTNGVPRHSYSIQIDGLERRSNVGEDRIIEGFAKPWERVR